MRLFQAIPMAAFCLSLAGCGGGSPPTTTGLTVPDVTQASGATVTSLATGSVTAAPRSFCPGISSLPFSAGQTATHQHAAAFEYVVSGVATTQVGTTITTTGPGQASFVPEQVIHTHTNFGTVTNLKYVFNLRAAGTCSVPLGFPGATVIFAGPDAGLTAPSYTETLTQVVLANGGRTAQHTGTMQMFLVLTGSITFVSGGTPMTLGPNQGFFDTAVITGQEFDAAGGSSMLVFTVQ